MATIKAVIVECDDTVQVTEIEYSLESMQSVVGGPIQGVFRETVTVYVDEEGRLKDLPFNPYATAFAQDVLRLGQPLFGTALLLGPDDGEGNDTDVRPEVVDYFTKEN